MALVRDEPSELVPFVDNSSLISCRNSTVSSASRRSTATEPECTTARVQGKTSRCVLSRVDVARCSAESSSMWYLQFGMQEFDLNAPAQQAQANRQYDLQDVLERAAQEHPSGAERPTNQTESVIACDNALITTDFRGEGTTSRHDRNPMERVTVRLSTPALRERGAFYTLHWEPWSGFRVSPRTRVANILLQDRGAVDTMLAGTDMRDSENVRSILKLTIEYYIDELFTHDEMYPDNTFYWKSTPTGDDTYTKPAVGSGYVASIERSCAA
ncbi:hypothetical protein PV11_09637 [Exophiala sideris]|uniref:Uncharacterized protein n=1 Tax=Exophiala sideris TaxID=1016849 RepID=A0A0D1YAI6_9EURO|nr:hypothetical protein PV11_09637 [Exophiala sideris]